MRRSSLLAWSFALLHPLPLAAHGTKTNTAPPSVRLQGVIALLDAPSVSASPPLNLNFNALSLRISPPIQAALPAQIEKWQALSLGLQTLAPAHAEAAPNYDSTAPTSVAALPTLTWQQAAKHVEEALARFSETDIKQAGPEQLSDLVADISRRLQGESLAATHDSPRSRLTEESDGFTVRLMDADGRTRRFKIFSQDGLALERRSIPRSLAGVYQELPEGGIRKISADPLAPALRAAGIEIWTVRHGETETNRKGLLAGGGTDAPLTATPNEKGLSGAIQARAAAEKLYASLGGDEWASQVLSGRLKPAVILSSPLRRARQTAAAFTSLLDAKRMAFRKKYSRPLYEVRVAGGLAEMRYGSLEQLPLDAAKLLSLWRPWAAAPSGAGRDMLDRFPGIDDSGRPGESRFDVILRQRNVLRRIIRNYKGRKVITFAHYETVTAQRVLFDLLNVDPRDQSLQVTPVENAQPIKLTD